MGHPEGDFLRRERDQLLPIWPLGRNCWARWGLVGRWPITSATFKKDWHFQKTFTDRLSSDGALVIPTESGRPEGELSDRRARFGHQLFLPVN
jgi:hypothetical protein